MSVGQRRKIINHDFVSSSGNCQIGNLEREAIGVAAAAAFSFFALSETATTIIWTEKNLAKHVSSITPVKCTKIHVSPFSFQKRYETKFMNCKFENLQRKKCEIVSSRARNVDHEGLNYF